MLNQGVAACQIEFKTAERAHPAARTSQKAPGIIQTFAYSIRKVHEKYSVGTPAAIKTS
jgi:hypothetical protein